jgi:hypothetical protein
MLAPWFLELELLGLLLLERERRLRVCWTVSRAGGRVSLLVLFGE